MVPLGPVASPLPPLPPNLNRGYCAQFYWAQHYPPAREGGPSIPASMLPQFTEVVASIPSIFQQICSILLNVEFHVHGRVRKGPAAVLDCAPRGSSFLSCARAFLCAECNLKRRHHCCVLMCIYVMYVCVCVCVCLCTQDILPELDRKILKQLTPKEAEAVNPLEKKLILRSPAAPGTEGAGQDYFIHACRRENVRLVFASAEEGGVLGKLRLCPLLIDLFVVLPGTNTTLPRSQWQDSGRIAQCM